MQKRCPYNRMVVNARTNEVEQITHYYPYGGIIGNLSSNQEAQKYKYSGKALAATEKVDNLRREREALAEGMDRTYGLDLYDFHARLFNPALPVFDRPDPLSEKFTWLTPYNYCAGDSVNCVDPDGRNMCVLSEPQGASGAGHMAILIQRPDQKWYLFSKNGTNDFFGFSGPNSSDKGDDIAEGKTVPDPETGEPVEVGYDSPQDFLDSEKNKENGEILYTEGYVMESSGRQDAAARDAAVEELNKGYNLLGSNCAYTVQQALSAAGFNEGSFSFTKDCPGKLITTRIPNRIYDRIKLQNVGQIVTPKK